jgi:hypothetical protein
MATVATTVAHSEGWAMISSGFPEALWPSIVRHLIAWLRRRSASQAFYGFAHFEIPDLRHGQRFPLPLESLLGV